MFFGTAHENEAHENKCVENSNEHGQNQRINVIDIATYLHSTHIKF